MRNVLQITALHVLAVYAIRAFHPIPVVFVGDATTQAYLVMMSIAVNTRPREPVRAGLAKYKFQELQWVTPWLRLFQWSSQREKNGLCCPSSRPFSVESRMFGGWDFDKKVSTDFSLLAGSGP